MNMFAAVLLIVALTTAADGNFFISHTFFITFLYLFHIYVFFFFFKILLLKHNVKIFI